MYLALTSAVPQTAGMGDFERERYAWMFYPPPYQFAMGKVRAMEGLGCAGGKCDCGGACQGMGDTDPAVLAQLSDAMGTMNLGTWLLVGLTGWGLYRAFQKREFLGVPL